MTKRYRNQWENLGNHDPYWAVLTEAKKKGGKWDKNRFFLSGKLEIESVMDDLKRINLLPAFGTALDFGCGVGRLTKALSPIFSSVIGVDISSAMLAEARKQHSDVSNTKFLHNTATDLRPVPDDSIDFVYSNIVLQHMPPAQQRLFIAEFCRILRIGGVMVIQSPSDYDLSILTGWIHRVISNRLMNIYRRFRYGKNGIMEIHVLHRSEIVGILNRGGVHVRQLKCDNSTGSGLIGFRYYGVKEA